MGYGSQAGAIVVGAQSAPGTPNSTLATDGIGLRLTSGSLAGNRELLVTDPEIGGGRDTSDAYLGAVSFGGDYEMYVRFKAVAFFLYHAFGVKASVARVGDTAVFDHTLTPTDSSQLPMFTVYERISNNLERFLYTDAVVNTFHLEADANGFLTSTVGIIARLMNAGAAAVDPTDVMDNTSLVVGTNITLTYDGVTVPAKSFSFDVNNNITDDNFFLGSFFLGDMTAQNREVTASMTVEHTSASMMRQALLGTPGATAVGGLTTKKPLVITCEAYENIPGTTANAKYKLELELPKVIFSPFAFEPSGADPLENDVEMTAVRPDIAAPVATAVVSNEFEEAA
ncbi:major tail protein [Gordonia phage Gibbles]|uniref:Major tail protein n=3 Tax=Gordonia phage Orchid TaxID=1838075 RepID=A0A160DHG0_9CAUD|nr:major tail protein [Gordonia phage Orchid]ANA87255.1 major tail protein [Gordonia phage PatrickStar]ANA87368.1 major tail protein [Gordonia phage Orchid]ANA87482.1 major tail protein [Gordonia phage Kampe]QDK01979.1 major tail protein [Gordonia phage Gibbles]